MPTVGIAQQNISFGNPFGNRFSATDYVNPERSRSVEISNANIAARAPIASSPDVGAAGFSRNVQTGAGGKTEQIVSPYGFASTNLTPQQMEQRALARSEAERTGTMPRSPEQQQALLAQMRQAGAGIRERIAATNAQEAEENLGKYYAFRQGIAERQAQIILDPRRRSGELGGVEAQRARDALAEAARFKRAAEGGGLTNEPVMVSGIPYQQAGMGQWSRAPFGSPASQMTPIRTPSAAVESGATGSISSGVFPSFANGGIGNPLDWQRRNFPQDFFTGAFGSQGRRMIKRTSPFDQTTIPL